MQTPSHRLAGMAVDWFGGHVTRQTVLFIALAGLVGVIGQNLSENLGQAGITPGFAFLGHPANFEIGETLIAYSSQSSFGRAVLVGVLNTLVVSAAGCVLATVIGLTLGVARLSSNPLLTGSVRVYVEVIRNTPLLLQLFFWNSLLQALPPPRQALEPLPSVLLSNRGVFIPAFKFDTAALAFHITAIAAVSFTLWLVATWWLRQRPQGKRRVKLAIILGGMAAAGLVVALGDITVEIPRHRGFNITGGLSLTTEFSALLIGLVVNASAGISEIVRAGLSSVPRGQWQAGRALGLHEGQILRFVILPQALRVVVPLMTSSYLSLTKNSSLAVAIGYPDVVSILNTAANQTGQALEAIMIMITVYLSISLAVSLLMNRFNARHVMRAVR